MRLPLRSGVVGLGLASVILFGAIPLVAQQEPDAKTAKVAKKKNDPSRRVPNYFGDLGLTEEQRESIYKVRAKYQARLDELKKETNEINTKLLEESEAVLTPTQKELLVTRRKAAGEAKKAAAKKAAEAKKAAAAQAKNDATKPANP